MRRIAGITNLFLLVVLALTPLVASATENPIPEVQNSSAEERASFLLSQLSPEERVGQLFLVTLNGTDTQFGSTISDLIRNYHVGGVILLAENDNFTYPDNTIEQTWSLTRRLQSIEWATSQEGPVETTNGETFLPEFIPLFIGINQEGGGHPYDQILNGMTPLPNPMAIGATWNTDLAQQVGTVMGQELAALGVNLLFGPSLDILERPSPESPGDFGTRTFGGDPFWVGEMGRSFVTGVHQGSRNRVALAGKHFPGLGGADRPISEEVSTVRKSLEQLKQIELATFFAVTGLAPSPEATIDALLTAHIRYQGLQGNIRATTSPISFDPQAFELLMSLSPLATWRDNGGVVISDNLGSRAVRRFYDTSGLNFDGRFVARDAFLSGNDLLYLGDFSNDENPETTSTVPQTIAFFTQKYREDSAFAQRVDQSVLRTLTLKYRLYGTFTHSNILPPSIGLETVGRSGDVIFNVAQASGTLISPSPPELENVLPGTPELNDRIVIISDTYEFQQCSGCPPQSIFQVDGLKNAIVDLYGPETGAPQILPYLITSFSFESLKNMLDSGTTNSIIERSIRRADWIVFAMLDVRSDRPNSTALRQLLSIRPDLLRNKRVILFAFGAPYYLDATDITKFTAYYALYSKEPAFIEVAARMLFKELQPISGSLPVSVTGIQYDLITATSPNPDQTIPLILDLPEPTPTTGQATVEPTPLPAFKIGDLVPVRTGVILDHNGHPVPDGTPVDFLVNVAGQELIAQSTTTVGGIARLTITLGQPGTFIVLARSGEPPAESIPLEFDVPGEIPPTVEATATPSPSPSATPSHTPSPIIQTPSPTPTPPITHTQADIGDWFLAFMITAFVGWSAYRLGNAAGTVRWGIRWGLCVWIGGFIAYSYISLQLPGTTRALALGGRWFVLALTMAGGFIGWIFGLGWRSLGRRARR